MANDINDKKKEMAILLLYILWSNVLRYRGQWLGLVYFVFLVPPFHSTRFSVFFCMHVSMFNIHIIMDYIKSDGVLPIQIILFPKNISKSKPNQKQCRH